MSASHKFNVELKPTPQQLAEMFWEMGSVEQADFFAHLDQIAGLKLCFQMAFVVSEIQERSAAGDRSAQHGFQTMLAHAQDYVLSGIETACDAARREMARMAQAAQVQA